MEYNELGASSTDGVTRLGVTFEVPVAIRIQEIKAWINGTGTATFAVTPDPGYWDVPLSRTFPLEYVPDAPAKWQGVDSLKWDLQPGSYELFIAAPDVPLGYGYYGPFPTVDSLLIDTDTGYRNYSDPDDRSHPPFGLEVYGTPLSAVPEPSFYGLMGATGLLALAASRRLQRKVRRARREDRKQQAPSASRI